MVGSRRSSVGGRTEPSCLRFPENDTGASRKGVLLDEFNEQSEDGVRMPDLDLGRDASEFRPM